MRGRIRALFAPLSTTTRIALAMTVLILAAYGALLLYLWATATMRAVPAVPIPEPDRALRQDEAAQAQALAAFAAALARNAGRTLPRRHARAEMPVPLLKESPASGPKQRRVIESAV